MDELKPLEKFIGFEIPICVKSLLLFCGYDTIVSVKQITAQRIVEMQDYIRENSDDLFKNNGDVGDYNNQIRFEFLPGHRTILLSLPQLISDMQANAHFAPIENDMAKALEYSVVFTHLLETAKTNANKSKNAYQYDDIVKHFATYIFLLCGRACYETLNKNLPIPSTKTIRKFRQAIVQLIIFV